VCSCSARTGQPELYLSLAYSGFSRTGHGSITIEDRREIALKSFLLSRNLSPVGPLTFLRKRNSPIDIPSSRFAAPRIANHNSAMRKFFPLAEAIREDSEGS
jgi:hypothetical protein